jgi:integral membrane sensor domain MASE1
MKQESWTMLKGAWLPALGVAAYALAGRMGMSLFLLSDHGRPGDQPPWYFIRQDYIDGLVMGSMGLLCVVIGLLFMKRYPIWGGMLAWQSVTWFGGPAWDAFIIALRCDNVLNSAAATTEWQTFEAFMAEPMRVHGYTITFILAMVILAASIFMQRERQLSSAGLLKPVGEPRG